MFFLNSWVVRVFGRGLGFIKLNMKLCFDDEWRYLIYVMNEK